MTFITAVTFILLALVPATSNFTVFASLSYVMSSFWTVMSALARQVLNPDVVKTWPARAFPDRDPSNNKEMADNVEDGRSILSTELNASPSDVWPPK